MFAAVSRPNLARTSCLTAPPCITFSSHNRFTSFGRGDDTIGNPHRAQISQFELFELILLLKLDKQLPVERFEATVSQSTVPSPLLELRPRSAGSRIPGTVACLDLRVIIIIISSSSSIVDIDIIIIISSSSSSN